ncbi:MAG: hypothetical protein HQ500_09155 [Flavobacteriales bacterium]|nr:hypothetical protein [Flavobacteriales bacterium]
MKSALLAALLCCITLASFAQKRYRYIGLMPGGAIDIIDPYYPIARYDINVVPFVFETPINTVTDIKCASIGIYRYGDSPRLSAVGGQLVFPRYFKAKQRYSEKSKGWYLGPFVSGTRDFYRNLYTASPGLEFGAIFEDKRSFALSLNIQAGGTYEFRLNRKNAMVPFVAINLGFGFWVKQKLYVRGGSV